MKYKEFHKFEEDSWSLTRPTFPTPKGGILTVIGHNGKTMHHKRYIVKCSRCINDPELFNRAIFKIPKSLLVAGTIPCGCSRTVYWSDYQYGVLCKRKAFEKGFKFLKIHPKESRSIKAQIECSLHGEWDVDVWSFLGAGVGCPVCGREKAIESKNKGDRYFLEKFFSTGKFKEGTIFCRNSKRKWSYKCPVCSHDEYVKAGVCSGIFIGSDTGFKKGVLACRCSNYYWTKEQYFYKINKIIKSEDLDYSDIKIIGDKINCKAKMEYICPEHGKQVQAINKFVMSGQRCPDCKGKSQKEAYINLVKSGETPVAIKFGISRSSERRIYVQNLKNSLKMDTLFVYTFSSVQDCKNAEKECKQHINCGILSPKELKDGWTESASLYDLDKVKEIYEKNGGKIKEETI